MNMIFLTLLIAFIIAIFLYYFRDNISRRIPYKDSIVIAENEDGCILVPAYMTRYVVGGRRGINVSVDGTPAANVKPGDTVSVPIMPGIRKISAYWYSGENFDIEVCIDENTMIYVYTGYDGFSTTTYIKELKKNERIDESKIEKEYREILRVRKPELFGLFKWSIIVVAILIVGIIRW